jgi:hypothetical protein
MTANWGAAAIVCVTAFITSSECLAQSVPVAADEEVFVRLVDSKREVRGRLVHLDASTLSIWGRNGRVDFPLTRVARVDKKERDSLVNGAMFGLLYVGACTIWWCSQGLSTSETSPADVIGGAVVGAAVGALVDAAIKKRVTIYRGPAGISSPPAASIAVTLRF